MKRISDKEIRAALYNKVAEDYRAYTTTPDNQCFDQEDYENYLKDGDAWSSEVFEYGLELLQTVCDAQLNADKRAQ